MSEDINYYLEPEDFFKENFARFNKIKDSHQYKNETIQIPSISEFQWSPFANSRDFQIKLKSPLVVCVTCLVTAADAVIIAARNLALMALHLLVFDIETAADFLVKAFIDCMRILYFALSAILDTLLTTVILVGQIFLSGYAAIDKQITGNEWEVEDDSFLSVSEKQAEAYLETKYNDTKMSLNDNNGLANYRENYHNRFFEPFQGDFQTQLKAPIAVPLIYLATSFSMFLDMMKQLLFAVLNLGLLDKEQAKLDAKLAWHDFECGVYFVINTIIDTTHAVLKLATRIISTSVAVIDNFLSREPSTPSLILP